jgi:hypothetical protein
MAASSSGSGTVASATGPSTSIPKERRELFQRDDEQVPEKREDRILGRCRQAARRAPRWASSDHREIGKEPCRRRSRRHRSGYPLRAPASIVPTSSCVNAGRIGSDDPCQEPEERVPCIWESRPRAPSPWIEAT